MSKLVDIRANISYSKNKEGVMVKNTEVILLSAVADYKYADGKVVRDTKIVQSRFDLNELDFDILIQTLTGIKNSTEADYV